MTIEIGLLVALISTAGGLTFGMIQVARNKKHDTKSDTACISEMMVKLNTIEKTVEEIRNDMKEMAKEGAAVREKLLIVESSDKSAHKRIDRIENNKGAQ